MFLTDWSFKIISLFSKAFAKLVNRHEEFRKEVFRDDGEGE